jgi:hypothetical protein
MNSKLNEDGFPGGIGTGLTLPGGYINGAPTGSVDETNNTKPSSKMRPEPHPTRHETEHPADEPDWYKRNNPYKSVSEILTKEEEDKIFEEFLSKYFSILEGTDSAWTDGFAVTGKEHNDTWEEFDNPEQGYTDMLPGWNVQGHLSDSLPKSVKDRVLPKDNHFEENGEMKRVMHPSKGEAYAQEKKERWEMNPMTASEKIYAPEDAYKPVSIQEASNPIMDKELPYTNSLGQQKKIKVKDALRLPRKHPAHIQAVKLIGPSDAPANEPKPKAEPGKAAQAAAKPAQMGQPVKKGQTAQGQINKPSNNNPDAGEQQAPPPQKLSGVELLSNAEKRAKKEKEGMNEGISESKENSIQHFIEYATKRLKLKETPKVTLLTGQEYSNAKTSLGGYNPMTKEIFVVMDGRLTADICRTIAHEMVHRKQDELGLVKNEVKDGADGSPIENQAHAVAGILMREYGRINKQIYKEDINVDVDKGDTVLMGKFKNKKVVVKDFGKDDHGMPTINGKVATTFRMGDKGQNVFKKDEEKESINEELLLEGGAAGHLAHPYEDSDLTFADMKEMINRGLIGGLDKEAPVSEKLDGQNIAFTVKNGEIRFGRNKGHVKNAGENSLDVKGITQQFAGRGGIEKAFKNSAEDLQAAVKKLPPEQINKMFGNGSKFMSLEIILPETQNVIPYGKNVLVMHGTIQYNKDGEQIGRSTEDAKAFAQAVQKAGADKQKTFKIEGPKEIEFDNSKTKEYTQKAKQYNSELDKTIKQFGLNDKSKLEDYKRAWWNKELDNQGIKFSKQEKEGLIKRFADDDKSFGSKNFNDDKKREWFKNYETNELAKSQKKMINPIEMVFLNSGAQVLKRVNNFLSNDTKSKNALKKDTLESIKGIKNSKDPDKIAKLQKELQRLNAIGMDNVVPSEGVVFQYKGHPYKFTGAFAPINQINGTFKFDKPKKKEPTSGNEPKNENPKNTVAIFSGRFQPFHAGHYSIYKALVDKFGKDNVYIASSNTMDDIKSPFNFRDKKNIMTTMFGIPSNKVVQVKNPYAPTEILDKLPKDTKYVTAVSQKDAERLEKGGKYFKNYDKVPDNKKKSYKDEGYFIVAPEMQLKVNGKNISGTQLRATFGSDSVSLPEKKKIFQQIYPKFDKDVFAKIVVTTKKSEKIKKSSEPKSKQADTKKQLSPDVISKNPKVRKLLSTTIKNPETGRMIKVSSALRYDKKSKVRQNVDRMIKQQFKK